MSGVVVPISVEVHDESLGKSFDGTVSLLTVQPVTASKEGSTVKIYREDVRYDEENVILNEESLGVNKTIGGGTISAVVEAESVDVNAAPVSTIFDGSTALVNG